jgi:hypothetical protein
VEWTLYYFLRYIFYTQFSITMYVVYLSEGKLFKVKKGQVETGLCCRFCLIVVKHQVENRLFTMYI